MLDENIVVKTDDAAAAPPTKVLIVDDEQAIRRFLRTSLSAHGYEVHEAANGEDAIMQAINARPDLIILDLGLPGIDGIEVTRRIREWMRRECTSNRSRLAIPAGRYFFFAAPRSTLIW